MGAAPIVVRASRAQEITLATLGCPENTKHPSATIPAPL